VAVLASTGPPRRSALSLVRARRSPSCPMATASAFQDASGHPVAVHPPRRSSARRGRSARRGGGCSQATSAGTVVRYVARLRNQRRGRERLASSLWDVTLNNGTRTTRIRRAAPRPRAQRELLPTRAKGHPIALLRRRRRHRRRHPRGGRPHLRCRPGCSPLAGHRLTSAHGSGALTPSRVRLLAERRDATRGAVARNPRLRAGRPNPHGTPA
jgi:hypothetical protein